MPRNLLLADDSITIQKVVGITFAGEDFSIVAVDNGEDAVRKARELRPDVILADVVMPKRNGYEVCEAIKNDPDLAHIPVLLLAGTFEAFDESRARAARADAHIAKPFESQALINKVRELLDRPVGSKAAPVSAPGMGSPPPGAPVPPAQPPGAPAGGASGFARSAASSAIAPPVRLSPPVLSRAAAPVVVPTAPPPSPRAPDARAPSVPLGTSPAVPEESFEFLWGHDESPAQRAPEPTTVDTGEVPRAQATVDRSPVGDLDWAALGFETDAAARAGARRAVPPQQGPSSSPARSGAPATSPPSPASSATQPTTFGRFVPTQPTGAGLPVPPARVVPAEPRPSPPSFPASPASPTAPTLTGGIPLHRQASGGSALPPFQPVGGPGTPPVSSSEFLALGEPIDLAELEVEEPTPDSRDAFEAKPAIPPAPIAPDGGEAQLREALSKASREVIERIAWEVVPTLAETIIREHVERLVKDRDK